MTYPKLPGLTWDGTLYQNDEMGTVEALLPTGGWPTAHAPAMVELPDGDLLCCWFAGTYEGSADIHIICSLLPKDAPAWLPPVDISGDPTRSEQNPSLFYGPDGAVWAMYTAQLDRVPGKDNMQFTSVVRCQKSFDGGRTWGPYEPVDLLQLDLHRLGRRPVGGPHRLPPVGRRGQDLADGHDAQVQRPCPRQRGGAGAGAPGGLYAQPRGLPHPPQRVL